MPTQRAVDIFNENPARAGDALDLLDRAAGLNPHSTVPRLLSGQLVVALGQPELARALLPRRDRRATRGDEYAHLALGALESSAGPPRGGRAPAAPRHRSSARATRWRATCSPRSAPGRRIGIQDVNKDFNERRENRGR